MTVSGPGRAVVSPYHGSAHPSPCLSVRHGLGATVAVSHHHQPTQEVTAMTRHRLPHEMDNPLLSLHPERTTTMTTDYSTPEFPADEFPPDYNFSALYSLFVAHVALLDPNDEQGVEWLLTQARGLCRRYFVAESYVESTANEFVDRIL